MGNPHFFPHQISITGLTASGTSSAMRELKTRLPDNLFRFVSVDAIMRHRALQMGLSIEEFVKHRIENPNLRIDVKVDEQVNVLGLTDFSVLESRLGFRLWPMAYQVRLTCPLEHRAARRAKQEGVTTVQARFKIKERDADDDHLYTSLYGPRVLVEDSDPVFNLVIDTSTMGVEEVADTILRGHESWKARLDPVTLLQPSIWVAGAINFEKFYFP